MTRQRIEQVEVTIRFVQMVVFLVSVALSPSAPGWLVVADATCRAILVATGVLKLRCD